MFWPFDRRGLPLLLGPDAKALRDQIERVRESREWKPVLAGLVKKAYRGRQ